MRLSWVQVVTAVDTWPAKNGKKKSETKQQFSYELSMKALQKRTVQSPSAWRTYTLMNVSEPPSRQAGPQAAAAGS